MVHHWPDPWSLLLLQAAQFQKPSQWLCCLHIMETKISDYTQCVLHTRHPLLTKSTRFKICLLCMSKKRYCITDAAALPHTKLLLQFISLSYKPTNHQLSGSHCILSVKTGLRKSAIPRQERDNKLNVKTLTHRGSYLEDDLRYSES